MTVGVVVVAVVVVVVVVAVVGVVICVRGRACVHGYGFVSPYFSNKAQIFGFPSDHYELGLWWCCCS